MNTNTENMNAETIAEETLEQAAGGVTPGRGRGHWQDFDTHLVSQGDTLSSIARSYNVSRDEVMVRNGLKTSQIFIGRTLIISHWIEGR